MPVYNAMFLYIELTLHGGGRGLRVYTLIAIMGKGIVVGSS